MQCQVHTEIDGGELDKLVESGKLDNSKNNSITSNNQVESSNSQNTSALHESTDDLCPLYVQAVESIVSTFKVNVDQYSNMQNLVKYFGTNSRQHETDNMEWSNQLIVQIVDFAQNVDLPHFGSEQPGSTYYNLPLDIYLFGIILPYKK